MFVDIKGQDRSFRTDWQQAFSEINLPSVTSCMLYWFLMSFPSIWTSPHFTVLFICSYAVILFWRLIFWLIKSRSLYQISFRTSQRGCKRPITWRLLEKLSVFCVTECCAHSYHWVEQLRSAMRKMGPCYFRNAARDLISETRNQRRELRLIIIVTAFIKIIFICSLFYYNAT